MTPQELETREDQFTTAANREERSEPLFGPNDSQGFRSRREKIQIGFVDEPMPSSSFDNSRLRK